MQRQLRHHLEALRRAGVEALPKIQLAATVPIAPDQTVPDQVPPAQTATAPTANVPTAATGARGAEASDVTALTSDLVTPTKDELPKPQRLQQLALQVKACELCPQLVANRTQTVFGVGNPDARLCFFGEAPGADEDRKGEPFVGPAGQLLDRIIQACTLSRSDVYILNTVKCRPPGNRNPEADEVAHCRPFFEQQLEILRPEYICCLGSVAAAALLETTQPVGRLRGKLHPWRWAQVAVTYHPAYLLRQPDAKRKVWDDMKMLMRQMGIMTG